MKAKLKQYKNTNKERKQEYDNLKTKMSKCMEMPSFIG